MGDRILGAAAGALRRWWAGASGTSSSRGMSRVPTSADVDDYWASFTVRAEPFDSPAASLAYLDWRFEQYPLFREFMGLYGDHERDVVLDYGCGPGNDIVGFLVLGRARKVGG